MASLKDRIKQLRSNPGASVATNRTPSDPAAPAAGAKKAAQTHSVSATNARKKTPPPSTGEPTAVRAAAAKKAMDPAFRPPTDPVGVTYSVQRKNVSMPQERYQELKLTIQNRVYDILDPTALSNLQKDEIETHIRRTTTQLLMEANVSQNAREREVFLQDIVDEITGYGPLEPLLRDPAISDILVNGAKQTYVELEGRLQLTDVEFRDDRHLLQVIDRIVTSIGRHIDEGSPMCDARLPDGSRVNAIIPPLAIDGPSLSIRKFKADVLGISELVNRYDALTPEIAMVFEACVKARMNILISGGTGAGKTTLLNILSSFIPHNQRVVTIEDSAELQLQQPHVVRLETRPPNIEGKGEVTQYDLLKNSLRMRPDRIILGEVRGREALDMLQAMNTGHDGSMSTVHANTPRDALSRLETMIAMAGIDLPQRAMRQQVSSAIDIICQQTRLSDGSRKLTYFSEVLGMEGDIVTMQDIFVYERRGISEEGKVIGQHVATGVQPRFMQRLRASGLDVPAAAFLAPEEGT